MQAEQSPVQEAGQQAQVQGDIVGLVGFGGLVWLVGCVGCGKCCVKIVVEPGERTN